MTRRGIVAAGMAAFTLVVIVWPLEMSLENLETARSRTYILPGHLGWFLDALRNVAAFVPLGAALAGLPFAAVAAVSAVLSGSAEVIQLFQPERFVSLPDIALNTAGGLLGRSLAAALPVAIVTLRLSSVGLRAAATSAMVLLTLAGVLVLDAGMRPSGWETGYVVAKNSSALGRVPWCGTLDSLEIRVGDERWTGDDLSWQPRVMERGPCRGATWWAGSAPPSLARAVQAHEPISLQVTATPTLEQGGPARILTWAHPRDGRRRNVLIAQESDSLVVHVRRSLGGEEGRRPYYVVPGVFAQGTSASVGLDMDGEKTIIRTHAGTIVHRYDPAQDWVHLLRGRSRYRAPGPGRAILFWSVAAAPAAAVAAIAAGAAGLPGAVAWIGGSALAILAGGALLTDSPPAAAALAWGLVTLLALAARSYAVRGSPRLPEPVAPRTPSPGSGNT